MNRFVPGLLFAASLLLLAPVFAQNDPQQVVRQTTERMLQALQARRAELAEDKGLIYGLVEDIVVPHFDFHRISRYVLGKHWRSATAVQREAFVAQFRELLMRTYALALLNYSDQRISYPSQRFPQGATRVKVSTAIRPADAAPIPIDYRLHLNGSEWMVYDVVIEGVSLVVNYRKSFASEISRVSLDGLIERLEKRNAGVK